MAKNAVVFSGRNGLDFSDLRAGVLRIPEVTMRIREAQAILDSMPDMPTTDLWSTIAGDDEHFFRNIKMKSLAAAVVQVGLFDRLLKTQRRPDYMVGNSNGDSAMLVCSGRITFREMVEKSQTPEAPRPQAEGSNVLSLVVQSAPLLSGLSLTEYQAVKLQDDGTYAPATEGSMDLRTIVANLHLEQEVLRFVNIGPANAIRTSDYRMIGTGEAESVDSIEMDPMLGWFWRSVRPQAMPLAQ